MNFKDLQSDQVFRFIEEGLNTYDYIKIDDTTFVHADTFQVVQLDDEVFDGIIDRVEVEAWDPDRDLAAKRRKVRQTPDFSPYYEEDSAPEPIELVENYYFPDYELVAVRGESKIDAIVIHCWRTSDIPELHRASVWVNGAHVMDTTRESIEMIIASPEMTRDMFGEL